VTNHNNNNHANDKIQINRLSQIEINLASETSEAHYHIMKKPKIEHHMH